MCINEKQKPNVVDMVYWAVKLNYMPECGLDDARGSMQESAPSYPGHVFNSEEKQ